VQKNFKFSLVLIQRQDLGTPKMKFA